MTSFAMIEAAAGRLAGIVNRTPLLESPFLNDMAGRRVLVKAECLQHTGSFKFRGAWSAISALEPEVRSRGIIAFSSGNHAQGIALAARRHDAPAVIVMPADAPRLKIDNTRALGAEVILYDRATEDRDEIGARLSQERGLTLIKPFDEPQVIAGQGTCGLEVASQLSELGIPNAELRVPCGGGGLTSGIALALASVSPDSIVRTVEPEGFDDVARSLASNQIERNPSMGGSICDAIVTPSPGQITFPILQAHCGAGLVISEEEVLRTMALAFMRLKIVIEPGGAVALASALFGGERGDSPIVAVASGGNVDAALFSRALDQFA
jgi:threonine dehydratase